MRGKSEEVGRLEQENESKEMRVVELRGKLLALLKMQKGKEA